MWECNAEENSAELLEKSCVYVWFCFDRGRNGREMRCIRGEFLDGCWLDLDLISSDEGQLYECNCAYMLTLDNRSRYRTKSVFPPSGSLRYTCCVALIISLDVRALPPLAFSASCISASREKRTKRERCKIKARSRTASAHLVAGFEKTAIQARRLLGSPRLVHVLTCDS